MNKEWHLVHRMPNNATMEEGIAGHIEHSKHGGYRPVPDKLKAVIKKRKAN